MKGMTGSRRGRMLLGVFTGLLYFVSFPPVEAGAVAFVALVPLLAAARCETPGRAFLLGWLAGTVACTALVSTSVFEAASRYFEHATWGNALFAFMVPQLYGAPYVGVFAALVCRPLRDRSVVMALFVVPAAWVVCEFVRSNIGHGAPWVLLAHSQHDWIRLIQIAEITGAFGVSFLVIMVNVAALLVMDAVRGRRRARDAMVAAGLTMVVIAGVLTFGSIQSARWRRPQGRTIRIALVQGNVPQRWRYSPREIAKSVKRFRELTARTAADKPDLVVWPENAVGVLLPANAELLGEGVDGLVPDGRLLLGAPRALPGASGSAVLRNSAFLLDEDGEVDATYDKIRLTPFAESSPWRTLPWLHSRSVSDDLYTSGTEWTIFDLPAGRFATMICYEAIYPDIARRFVSEGAELFVNISNDDWFGQRPALAQHLHAALFRAIENRRFLLRATNSGLTVVVDPRGAIVEALPPSEPGALVASVVMLPTITFYARYGDVFAWGCVLLLLALPLSMVVGRRRSL